MDDFDETSVETLSSLFNEGLDSYNKVNNSQEPTNDPSVQLNIKAAMRILERATRLVSFAGTFSRNEDIDEVATSDLQFFLLPALLGSLSLKLTVGERKDIINAAEVYFKDFLSRCNDYGLSNYEFKNEQDKPAKKNESELEAIATSVNTRANKIQRYREQKELKAKLADLKKTIVEHGDEDAKRDYYLTMIKSFIHEAVDELNSIEMEKPILDYMTTVKKDEKPPKRPPPAPLKPIIITKNEVQKAVYGAGYPSLPTMTVQEFYDKRVRDGVFPDPSKAPSGSMSLQQAALQGVELNNEDKEAEDKEKAVEADDEDNLTRMRNMDDFKDDHRRGWGNRMNRS